MDYPQSFSRALGGARLSAMMLARGWTSRHRIRQTRLPSIRGGDRDGKARFNEDAAKQDYAAEVCWPGQKKGNERCVEI